MHRQRTFMEHTAAEQAYLAPIDNMAEPDYLTVIRDISESEIAAARDDSINNSKYSETVEQKSESAHSEVTEVFLTVIKLQNR